MPLFRAAPRPSCWESRLLCTSVCGVLLAASLFLDPHWLGLLQSRSCSTFTNRLDGSPLITYGPRKMLQRLDQPITHESGEVRLINRRSIKRKIRSVYRELDRFVDQKLG